MAKLYFYYGAMNSGKTTRIIQCLYNYEEQGMRAILMKPKVDTKGSDYIVSRIGAKRKADFLIEPKANIYDIIVEQYTNVDLIVVDEAQFLTEDQVNQLMDAVVDLNIPIMCYGLRTDFKGNNPKYVYYVYKYIGLSKFSSGSGVGATGAGAISSALFSSSGERVLYSPL